MWAEGCAGGCAIALSWGRAERGRRRGAAFGSRRMPWEASYVGGGVRRRGVPYPCRGGAPEGVCRRGAAVGSRRMSWEASYVGGRVRWRGVPGVYIGCRPFLCKEVLLLGPPRAAVSM